MKAFVSDFKNLSDCQWLQKGLRSQGVYGLSILLHLGVFLGVQGLYGLEFTNPIVKTEITLVDIEGSKQGDGLATHHPQVQKAKVIPKAAINNPDEITTGKMAEMEAVGTGGTQSQISGTGQFGVVGGRQASLEERYSIELRQLLERYKTYPLIAKKLGHQGKVVVRFSLNERGEVLNSEVMTPSNSEILNKAALDLVRKIHGVKPFPEGLQKASWDFEIPVEYKM